MEVKPDTTIGEIFSIQELSEVTPYFMGQVPKEQILQMAGLRWEEFAKGDYSSWNSKDLSHGLTRLSNLAAGGQKILYPVYSEEECREDPYRKTVNLIYMPSDHPKTGKYILIVAGGAYVNVATMVEGMPCAADFNEAGYHVFCLNYRTFRPEFAKDGLMPRPIDDVAAAIRYIDTHADDFQVSSGEYAVCGFSAGAHLAAMWGTKHRGYAKYGIEAPEVLFLNYPVAAIKDWMKEEAMRGLFSELVGDGLTEETASVYYPKCHIDADYPPCFLTQCRDDNMVPFYNSEMLCEELTAKQVAFDTFFGNHGGHGYGRGTDTDVSGWINKAIAFWRERL